MKKPEGFFTNLGFEFSGAGLVVTNRRVGMTEPGVKNSTQGLENPGVGLEKPRPSPVTPKAGLKKGRRLGMRPSSFVRPTWA